MKRKRIVFIVAMTAIVFAVLAVALLKARDRHEIIGTIENIQPPICTQNMANPTCGDGAVTVRGETGVVKEYKYAVDKSGFGQLNITSLQKGTKIRIMVVQEKITSIELAE